MTSQILSFSFFCQIFLRSRFYRSEFVKLREGLIRWRACGVELAPQRRNIVCTPFAITRHLAPRCLRYFRAEKVAGAWAAFGELGALLSNLQKLMELGADRVREFAADRAPNRQRLQQLLESGARRLLLELQALRENLSSD